MRDYFADVERLWDELVLHAEDFRAVPGSVIVIGHVTGRKQGLDVRRVVGLDVARPRRPRHIRARGRHGRHSRRDPLARLSACAPTSTSSGCRCTE